MSGWIRAEKELIDTIRFKRMVKAYRNALRSVTESDVTRDETLLLGALIRLWMFADSHIRDDNTLVITCDEIDELVGVEGFAKSLPADWLVVLDTERVELPDFLEHNGTSARQRKNNRERQSRFRSNHKKIGVTRDVTHGNARNAPRPDQTRPEETRQYLHERRATVPRGTNNDADEHAEWEATLAIYPPGAQRSDLIGAERAARNLVESGDASWEQLREGVTRYAACCKATNRLVLNPVKFFTDRDKPWSQAWPIPANKADLRLVGNVAAAEEFMRRTEPQS